MVRVGGGEGGEGVLSAINSPVALFPDKVFDEFRPPRVKKRWGKDGDDIIHVPIHVSLRTGEEEGESKRILVYYQLVI